MRWALLPGRLRKRRTQAPRRLRLNTRAAATRVPARQACRRPPDRTGRKCLSMAMHLQQYLRLRLVQEPLLKACRRNSVG